MLKTLLIAMAVAVGLSTALPRPAAAAQSLPHMELSNMMGRWYEVARFPNALQRGCQAGVSDWVRAGEGFNVVQSCRKGAPDGPIALWRAKARVADSTNARFKMSFFGGLVSQEYWVLDHRADQGWLILSTRDGKYLWLMSQKPSLPAAIRAQAVSRIRLLGFDASRLEFPSPRS